MFVNPDPSCTDDCRFKELNSWMSTVYHPPIYDKNGNIVNSNKDIHHSTLECIVCKRKWSVATTIGMDNTTIKQL